MLNTNSPNAQTAEPSRSFEELIMSRLCALESENQRLRDDVAMLKNAMNESNIDYARLSADAMARDLITSRAVEPDMGPRSYDVEAHISSIERLTTILAQKVEYLMLASSENEDTRDDLSCSLVVLRDVLNVKIDNLQYELGCVAAKLSSPSSDVVAKLRDLECKINSAASASSSRIGAVENKLRFELSTLSNQIIQSESKITEASAKTDRLECQLIDVYLQPTCAPQSEPGLGSSIASDSTKFVSNTHPTSNPPYRAPSHLGPQLSRINQRPSHPYQDVPVTPRRPDPTDLPDLPKYLAAKAELSAVMRDFTDNKIHFIGLDNHVVAMAEYQSVSKFTKSGECPSKFMKGEFRTYKTGYVKKTNSYTENTLFFPTFHPYAPQHISGML